MHDKIILFDATLLVQKKNMMCAGYIEQSNCGLILVFV